MNTRVPSSFLATVLVITSVWAAENKAIEKQNELLHLILKRSYKDGGYTVVAPDTKLDLGLSNDAEGIRQAKRHVALELYTYGIDVTQLVDKLFESNKEPVRLTIRSSAESGYVVDYDGKYRMDREEDTDEWAKWHKENPQAHGITRVSRPVYDEKSGLVLVYIGTRLHKFGGSGWIVLYRYDKGQLKEINKVKMWIS